MRVTAEQLVLSLCTSEWKAQLSSSWDVLGPFPIHAREQHFLSPSFPVNLSQPIDFGKTWPSSYADGGVVSWQKFKAGDDESLKVAFPNIRWSSLRATEGWAALQHHSVLHSTLTVYPPSISTNTEINRAPHLLVQLLHGSFFTILPTGTHSLRPVWYAGNIYAMERALPRVVELPLPPSFSSPSTYDIFVSGDYEIRPFGDPFSYMSDIPIQIISLSIAIEDSEESLIHEPSQDVVCHFVDGSAFGDAIGVGIRSIGGWWTVDDIYIEDNLQGIELELLRMTRIAPYQTRIIPIRIHQSAPFYGQRLRVSISATSNTTTAHLSVIIPITQTPMWTSGLTRANTPIRASYFYARSIPTAFIAIPPAERNGDKHQPPVLCLHGAGLDIFTTAWTDTLPKMGHSWTVVPGGRTSWGLDWHGPSATDAWNSLDALISVVNRNVDWYDWRLTPGMPAVVLGHSNGGQGVWFLASRYPDRVIAAIPAAAYIKSQAYVPLTMSRSAHYIDPALRAILESSLTPDDNDLFLSNLVDIPVLAIHGGMDDNVPVWHSREAINTLRAWGPSVDVTFQEDVGRPHWYPTVLNNPLVDEFLTNVLNSYQGCRLSTATSRFTLTVAIPAESGSMKGFRVLSLAIPGRLGRLHVETRPDGHVFVTAVNIRSFTLDLDINKPAALYVEEFQFSLELGSGIALFERSKDAVWKIHLSPLENLQLTTLPQPSGRAQMILSSKGPLLLVIPDIDHQSFELTVALQIAHDLNLHHRLDTEIIGSSAAISRLEHSEEGTDEDSNIVFIGRYTASFVHWLLDKRKVPFRVTQLGFIINGRRIDKPGQGIIALHPHPIPSSNMLLILGTDDLGLQRAARLFPIRTGVTVPDWLVLDGRSDTIGAAGVSSAGVWGCHWAWNEPMSWLY